jgi:hypothetical protein
LGIYLRKANSTQTNSGKSARAIYLWTSKFTQRKSDGEHQQVAKDILRIERTEATPIKEARNQPFGFDTQAFVSTSFPDVLGQQCPTTFGLKK